MSLLVFLPKAYYHPGPFIFISMPPPFLFVLSYFADNQMVSTVITPWLLITEVRKSGSFLPEPGVVCESLPVPTSALTFASRAGHLPVSFSGRTTQRKKRIEKKHNLTSFFIKSLILKLYHISHIMSTQLHLFSKSFIL